MAYSELIKDFERIRDYMRAFYVYGFKQRGEYDAKSARSYDNERRRIESWLGEYMSFHRDADGKHVFLSVDSRAIRHNPLYKAFKAKSFTANDIMLHFYLLDLLRSESLTVKEIVAKLDQKYLSVFNAMGELDESTVRKKLKEYEELGLVEKNKDGRRVFYSRSKDSVRIESWKDAVSFFSETDPLGVTGSFLLDKYEEVPEYYRFKHHYILHALDSEVLCRLFFAMSEGHLVQIQMKTKGNGESKPFSVCPYAVYISTQNGRQYLNAYSPEKCSLMFFRLDNIISVKDGGRSPIELQLQCETACREQKKHIWGVSTGNGELQHLEMLIYADESEYFIPERLEREKRCGTVEKTDKNVYCFKADVYDARELLPWIRTFTGRIIELTCSDESVTNTFKEDFEAMKAMYEVE